MRVELKNRKTNKILDLKNTNEILNYIKSNFDNNIDENIYIGKLVYKFFHKDYIILFIDNSEELMKNEF